jgi:hypothetical protein
MMFFLMCFIIGGIIGLMLLKGRIYTLQIESMANEEADKIVDRFLNDPDYPRIKKYFESLTESEIENLYEEMKVWKGGQVK